MTPNPKIREMLLSMGIIPESEHYEIAEAVLEECLSLCLTKVGNGDYNRGRMDCHDNIAEVFGVKK